ncbi:MULTISPECIES: IMP cyclohydrolase [Intestinimonas]|jgi:IMP cyclohydrolase|uniref:IMP cyclohydrolase n=1 Tax=Intestinimonas TaxID=1392389 RepID=UPI00051C4A2C|nr:IMP cyclohydrolase [Intestinimonas butyriciproducens]MDB7815791.1 IMP cyclohydrolase [Intestinimonas butyriciproducens]MDB7843439.1 IMP cyclohydrolase [Intestinimonas butyriciproducens]MDB7856813.1 IMP cyclohydrolase [Intestinimonas butyriciproducens]
MYDLFSYLSGNPYPGRGILLGCSADGRRAVIAYFIMGRSENSRNRVFEITEDGIRTKAFDESRMTDPSLIIYHPVRVVDGTTIVTNGDQTDTVADAFRSGGSWVRALRTREFEPDGPNYTPRISGMVRPDGSYRLAILKSADGNPACCRRFFYEYDAPIAGQGHFISTYQTDGDPLPSFEGEPRTVELGDETAAALADRLWNSLNADNKVSLFVRTIDLTTGQTDTAIKNKHQGE